MFTHHFLNSIGLWKVNIDVNLIPCCCLFNGFINFIEKPAGIDSENVYRNFMACNNISKNLVFLPERRRKLYMAGKQLSGLLQCFFNRMLFKYFLQMF